MPAATAACPASRLRVVIEVTASTDTAPVPLIRLLRTPTPSGLVRDSGAPATAASFRMIRSTSTRPVTAMPYLGSGSSTECPPPTWQPAACATSSPPRSTSAASSAGRTSRGQPRRFTATTGVPPIAYTSDSAFAAAIRPKVYASSITGVKKPGVSTSPWPPGSRPTAAPSPSSSPTTSSAAGSAGPPRTRPATTASSSPGGILQAQPPPCAYWVSRTVAGAVVTRTNLGASARQDDQTGASIRRPLAQRPARGVGRVLTRGGITRRGSAERRRVAARRGLGRQLGTGHPVEPEPADRLPLPAPGHQVLAVGGAGEQL